MMGEGIGGNRVQCWRTSGHNPSRLTGGLTAYKVCQTKLDLHNRDAPPENGSYGHSTGIPDQTQRVHV